MKLVRNTVWMRKEKWRMDRVRGITRNKLRKSIIEPIWSKLTEAINFAVLDPVYHKVNREEG